MGTRLYLTHIISNVASLVSRSGVSRLKNRYTPRSWLHSSY